MKESDAEVTSKPLIHSGQLDADRLISAEIDFDFHLYRHGLDGDLLSGGLRGFGDAEQGKLRAIAGAPGGNLLYNLARIIPGYGKRCSVSEKR